MGESELNKALRDLIMETKGTSSCPSRLAVDEFIEQILGMEND
jgi:hypothetical protein